LSIQKFPATSTYDDVVAEVIANDWVNAEYKRLRFVAPYPAAQARAGQFFNIECPPDGDDRPYLRRPMSTYSAASEAGELEFLYKVTGAGTRGLAALTPGMRTRVLGPLGNGFELRPEWRNIVILGRGVGLATLAPLAELAASSGVGVTALISARGQEQVLSLDRFAAIRARIQVILDSDGTSGMEAVEALLRGYRHEGRADAFFTCGSNRLMLLMQKLGREMNIPGQVAMEQQMACGLGMCFCCVRNFDVGGELISRRVCWDGPVFDLSEAVSW
jgi:dihydroorotate dehydrogenase electron transfer subunit